MCRIDVGHHKRNRTSGVFRLLQKQRVPTSAALSTSLATSHSVHGGSLHQVVGRLHTDVLISPPIWAGSGAIRRERSGFRRPIHVPSQERKAYRRRCFRHKSLFQDRFLGSNCKLLHELRLPGLLTHIDQLLFRHGKGGTNWSSEPSPRPAHGALPPGEWLR